MDLKIELEKLCSNVETNGAILANQSRSDFFSEYLSQKSEFKWKYQAILSPKDVSELKNIVEYANKKGFSLVPKGGGNSLAGQLFPLNGGFLLDLSNLNQILQVNIPDRYAIVECGVSLEKLIPALKEQGFYFPPSFNNYKKLTIGGIIGNNVSNTYRYYASDYILGLEVMLATGEIIKTGSKTLKNVSGYNTTSLFIGSEGSLGIVLNATIKLDPIPQNIKILLLESPEITSLIGWFENNWHIQEINYIKIISYGLNKKQPYHIIIETSDRNIDNLKENLKNLKVLSAYEIYEYSKFQEEIYSNTFEKFKKDKPLLLGFKTFIGNGIRFLKEIERIIKTYKLDIKLDITIINQAAYFLLIFSHSSLDEMKKIVKASFDLIKIVKVIGDGLIPDFGLNIWTHLLLDQDTPELFKYKDKIKSAFDPKNILNPKNYKSVETLKLIELIKGA